MRFTYTSGQRPLEGYTLKRGIGRGGFGEVYFAVSDGGKEVALKLLRDNQDIELRGVCQCLNLKHPNLVALYDLRTDARGDYWVVMEYVSGESLYQVLGRHPNGLPMELTREWFLALARSVGYLHDHGLVHRDLKPANIFVENGVLKVGDYGLSKSISNTQRAAQTQSIGTVHYMAPEISTGNYNKQIDVYAAGVILYEMLTGHVPFDGESAGEILMKHLTSPPDLAAVPGEYSAVVAKALAKNPTQRYATMGEMAQALEGVGRQPTPSTPVIAIKETAPQPVAPRPVRAVTQSNPSLMRPLSAIFGELTGSMALTTFFAALGTALWAAAVRTGDLTELGALFFLIVLSCWAVLVSTKFWTKKVEDSWPRRVTMLVLGTLIGAAALWLTGWTSHAPAEGEPGPMGLSFVSNADLAEAAAYLGHFALGFLGVRWWALTDRRRSQRFNLAPVLGTALWACIPLMIWGQAKIAVVVLIVSAVVLQLVSPWEEPPPAVGRRMRLRYA